jgi:uncharacterized membrane protein YfcA
MDVERIQHIMTSLMILSFLIFGALAGIVLITDAPMTRTTVSLPFAFLFIGIVTFIITGQIEEKPELARKYLWNWLIICIVGIVIGALAFSFY